VARVSQSSQTLFFDRLAVTTKKLVNSAKPIKTLFVAVT